MRTAASFCKTQKMGPDVVTNDVLYQLSYGGLLDLMASGGRGQGSRQSLLRPTSAII
jgi:hypothetical protein